MYAIIKRMRNLYFVIAVVFGSLVSGCATMKEPNSESNEIAPFSAQGWGGAICKDLNHDILPKNVGFQQAVQNIRLYQSWASGFVSGVNYADNDVYDVSGATTPEDIFVWLKNYCEQHLESAIPVALHELMEEWKAEGKILVQPE